MDKILMIYPMAAMVALSFVVVLALFRERSRAVTAGEIKASYFLTYSNGQKEGVRAKAISRHFSNLFEVPVLFYVGCLAIMIADVTNMFLWGTAWIYVVLRYLHAYIHTGSNNLRARIGAYFTSLFVLFALWLGLLIAVAIQ